MLLIHRLDDKFYFLKNLSKSLHHLNVDALYKTSNFLSLSFMLKLNLSGKKSVHFKGYSTLLVD